MAISYTITQDGKEVVINARATPADVINLIDKNNVKKRLDAIKKEIRQTSKKINNLQGKMSDLKTKETYNINLLKEAEIIADLAEKSL